MPHMNTPCWEWTGGTNGGGYGVTYDSRGQHQLAHRMAYSLGKGRTGAALVLHRCDHPPCVRPDHLFRGTHADNVVDKVSKGRHRWGERMPLAKLTEDDVREIRASKLKQRELSAKFGVSQGRISMIRNRKSWQYLE